MKLDGLTEPAVSVEIDTSLIGSFVWGISEWGGSDTWSGGNGEWTPVPAAHTRSLSIRRGRTREDQAVQPGTMTAVLDNLSGDYAPDNESSPWRWGSESLLQRGIGVRVRAGFRPAADIEAERLLKSAVLYLDAQNPGSTPTASVKNLGTGRAALNATLGSTAGADSNDPKWLPYTGTPYVYCPGVASNYLSVPDAAALRITGDMTMIAHITADDYTPASNQVLAGRLAGGNHSYEWVIEGTTGKMFLTLSTDGTTDVNRYSSVGTGLTDGASYWVAVTLDVDNGAVGNDVRFFTAADSATVPTSWTQVGSTTTTAGVWSTFAGTAALGVGSRTGGFIPFAGKVHRFILASGIGASGVPGGTTVLDIDTSVLSSGAATSFLATTGQTVTINRGTSGRKTAVVTESKWLLGTDDYMEVADNALLDFTASNSFTVLAVTRQWATQPDFSRIVDKSNSGDTGWTIEQRSTNGLYAAIDDGPNAISRNGVSTYTLGDLSVKGMIVNRTGQTLASFVDSTISATTSVSTVGDISNALPMRVGSNAAGGGGAFGDFEFVAAAVFRRALTATEIAKISTYYSTRAATPATMTTMYRGYIETVDADLGYTPTATITASDGLAKIANTQLDTIASAYSGDTTATRIGRILDAISWDTTLRSLSGSRTMLPTTYGASALNLADEAAACEYGIFYAAKDGTLTAIPYEAAFTTTLRFQLSDDPTAGLMDYTDLTTKPSTEYLVNKVNLTVGTATVTSTNDQSRVLRGEVSKTWTTPLDSTVTAQALADIICDRLSANTVRADSVEIMCAGLTTTEWGNVIAAELHERLTAARTTRDGRHRSYNCIIESVNHDITPRGWTLRMNLSPGLGGSFFVWGTSIWGGDDRWYY